MNTTLDAEIEVTDADVAEYRERGYWISPKLLSDDEIARLRDEVMRVVRGERDHGSPCWLHPHHYDPNSKAIVQMCNGWWINEAIREIVLSPKIGRIGARLMGTDEVRLWHDQVLYKPGSGSREEKSGNVGWHQDYGHWQCASTQNMCTAWIALQDTDLGNGGMRTIVGSHKWGLSEDSYTFGEKDLEGLRKRFEREGQPWIDEPCVLKAGQASFHHSLTFHGSGPNLSDQPRLSIVVHMMPADCAYRNHRQYHPNAALLGPGAREGDLYAGKFFPTIWKKG